VFASFPSPSSELVPVIGVRYYGLLIAAGVLAAVMLARRRWKAAGHDPDEIADIAVWAVPAGLIGARVYHVVTDFNLHEGEPWYWPFQIWQGGLGIPGGILFGVIAGVLAAQHYKIDVKECADAMVPAIPLAQAIGRLGNYFNQELFGRPTDLPWAVEIPDPAKRPNYPNDLTFHPTFAYEALWSLSAMGLLIWLDSKKILRPGKMLPAYVTAYFTGRLWVEYLRSDHANEIAGLRINTWVSLIMMVVGSIWLFRGGLLRPEEERGIRPEPWAGPADADSDDAVLGEDGVVEDGPEGDGPGPEVDVAESDDAEPGDGVDPQ
jgi:prolipoprotein diacylglyceryl transferase